MMVTTYPFSFPIQHAVGRWADYAAVMMMISSLRAAAECRIRPAQAAWQPSLRRGWRVAGAD